MIHLVALSTRAALRRASLCAIALAFTLSAPAAEPTATPSPTPEWLAERQPRQAKLLTDLGADQWHKTGTRGQGVKVLVLDTGFVGWQDHLGTALPKHVVAKSFRADHNLETKDQHGILCGEVVHALAPDAELLFADWDITSSKSFLNAVRWGREQGAKIITCSIVTPHWSDGEGRGAVHTALSRLLGHGKVGDMLCFASAGNTTERHWGGVFHDGGDGYHEWKPGVKENGISPWFGKDPVSVGLYWQPGADYDLTVIDTDTGKEVGTAHTDHNQGDRSSAIIYFKPESGHNYKTRVRLVRGPAGIFHLTLMEASLEYTVARASVCFPADSPDVIAVGAEDGSGHRVWYSACGPNSKQLKPDLMATIPFPTQIRERLFAGTSAAAPQAAATAALVWSRHPDWTAEQVRVALRKAARDLESPGPDRETGYGLIHLPRE